MDNLIFREAQLKDAAEIAKVQVKTWQTAYKGQLPEAYLNSLSIEQRKVRWQKILEKPEDNAYNLVAEVEGKVVGFCSVDKSRSEDMSEDTGELWAIYVDKNYQGKRIGTILLNKGLDNLRERGFKKAILWVLTSNWKTRKWYESKGWTVEGKTTIDKRDGFELEETRYITNLNG
jgi:ribosomal protein S18 acetylase RimI-like enzyme